MMYRFPGIKLARGEQSPLASQIRNEWFLARISDAISGACHTLPENREEVMAHAATAREALAICLETADAAIAEACEGLGIPNPLAPETSPGHRSNDGPRRPRGRVRPEE